MTAAIGGDDLLVAIAPSQATPRRGRRRGHARRFPPTGAGVFYVVVGVVVVASLVMIGIVFFAL